MLRNLFKDSEYLGAKTFYYSYKESRPYEVVFPKGAYFLELWGASGAGEQYGGPGGYAAARMILTQKQKLYLYVGEKGKTNDDSKQKCVPGGWNGGGEACAIMYQCSGGGASDIRTSKNDEYLDRIIIAGAGGGSSTDVKKNQGNAYYGGFGGGEEGGSVLGKANTDGIAYGTIYSKGGNQTHPGESYIKKNSETNYENSHGSFGVGGRCAGGTWFCGAGGGGYYGGGGGYDITPGGGGSGFCSSSFFASCKLISGNMTFPGKEGNETGHFGNGAIRITVLVIRMECEYPRSYRMKNLNAILLMIISS